MNILIHVFGNSLILTEVLCSYIHGEKKLLNQQMSSAGIGTAVFFVIFTDFSVGFTDCL